MQSVEIQNEGLVSKSGVLLYRDYSQWKYLPPSAAEPGSGRVRWSSAGSLGIWPGNHVLRVGRWPLAGGAGAGQLQ